MAYIMRRATPDDIPTIMGMLIDRQTWLQERGLDQWAGAKHRFQSKVAQSVDRGFTWLLRWDGEPVGTLSLTTHADADFWTSPHERFVPALYMTKMATHPTVSGNGLGRLMLDWARSYAYQRHGVQRLRWDVWRTNRALQEYYVGYGATNLAVIDAPGRQSGALFESYYSTTLDDFSSVTTDDNLAKIPISSSTGHWAGNTHDDSDHAYEGRWTQRIYRVINGLMAPSTTAESAGPPANFTLTIKSNRQRPLIFAPDPNDWCIKDVFTQRIHSWPATAQLVSGHPYRMELTPSTNSVYLVGYQPTVNI